MVYPTSHQVSAPTSSVLGDVSQPRSQHKVDYAELWFGVAGRFRKRSGERKEPSEEVAVEKQDRRK